MKKRKPLFTVAVSALALQLYSERQQTATWGCLYRAAVLSVIREDILITGLLPPVRAGTKKRVVVKLDVALSRTSLDAVLFALKQRAHREGWDEEAKALEACTPHAFVNRAVEQFLFNLPSAEIPNRFQYTAAQREFLGPFVSIP